MKTTKLVHWHGDPIGVYGTVVEETASRISIIWPDTPEEAMWYDPSGAGFQRAVQFIKPVQINLEVCANVQTFSRCGLKANQRQ